MSLGQEVPKHPWTKIATDIFHFKNESYLLLVDYTSRFPIVCKLTSTMAQQNTCKYMQIVKNLVYKPKKRVQAYTKV